LAHSDLVNWGHRQVAVYGASVRAVGELLQQPLFVDTSNVWIDQTKTLLAALRGDVEMLKVRNEAFIQQEMVACEDFFDTVERTPLTPEQRRAAVVMEDRNLLVASAGSGKTSTVVGKVGYVLLREWMAPEEILVVVFNAHAAREIEARIHACLKSGGALSIKVKTFHALGIEIIAEVEGVRPHVADGSDVETGALIADLLMSDAEFALMWAHFHAYYAEEVADPAHFETSDAWFAHVLAVGGAENGRYGFRTLQGEWAQTQSECAIANWLVVHGIVYRHRPTCKFQVANGQVRSYEPAFYIPEIDVYIEHTALDVHGHPPRAFAKKYQDFQAWKNTLPHDKRSAIIETFFSEFASGELFEKLKRELLDRGLVLWPLSAKQILEWIPAQQLTDVTGLIETFIKHAKSNQVPSDVLKARAQDARARLFVEIAIRVMNWYADKLQTSGAIDFEDMILKAARYAHEGRYSHAFRLILVDEFQDISQARANFLLGLLKNAPECKLFAVGDDWQSIYRFAGSDIRLFTDFEAHFGKTAINYLTRTFRSNQGIAEVASHFVQQNRAQMQKVVTAEDQNRKDTLVVRRYRRRSEVTRYVEACLEEVAQEADPPHTVYILGRYRHQVPASLADWETRYRDVLKIEYKTIHSSKGLQADYVIVIGMQAGGFPSERVDDALLQLVMTIPETHPHAEERRLFYVALTRARHRVYLIGSKGSPSCFLTELIHNNPVVAPMLRVADDVSKDSQIREQKEDLAEDCPQCGIGKLRHKKGKYGTFYGCSEFPVCRFTR